LPISFGVSVAGTLSVSSTAAGVGVGVGVGVGATTGLLPPLPQASVAIASTAVTHRVITAFIAAFLGGLCVLSAFLLRASAPHVKVLAAPTDFVH
jgi:hypothetical protein